ncbi:tau 95 subunit of transcription factor TFIIIC [Myotisia sp. PD_48]|nr:tau 95 subunit of transcription factor TFIIIC [Myotisia sp. PD_48]
MAHENVRNPNPDRTAAWYHIPPREIVSIEHPGIVKNVQKGIDTLQGTAGIAEILQSSHRDEPVNLLLNPEDEMSRPIGSISRSTNNILLRVSVPKRTGRKRKRGSQEPYVLDPQDAHSATPVHKLDARGTLERLQDNVGRYDVDVVGRVDRTHVFRGMPDFAYSTTNSLFVNKFRETILPFKYDKMKQFQLDFTKASTSNADIIPPPMFSNSHFPFQYLYRQNPAVKRSIDQSGHIITRNTSVAGKIFTHLLRHDVAEVPTKPRDNVPLLEDQDQTVIDTVIALQALFAERPGWTRRGLRNRLPTPEKKYALRHAIPYVAYLFRSGAWRDGTFRFGYDPRKLPEARIYQTLMFRMVPLTGESESREATETFSPFATTTTPVSNRRLTLPRHSYHTGDPLMSDTHIFTGQPPLPFDGKVWMITDITDPFLRRLLDPASPEAHPPREQCDSYSCGWYGNITLSIARAIMRVKILRMMENSTDWPSDEALEPLLRLTNHVEGTEDLAQAVPSGDTNDIPGFIRSEIRAVVRTVPWKMDQRREKEGMLKKRLEKRVRWEDQQEEEDEEGGEEDEDEGEDEDEDEEMDESDG